MLTIIISRANFAIDSFAREHAMSKFSSEDRSVSPFMHPLTEEWGSKEFANPIAQIYAGRSGGSDAEIFEQFCSRGEPVGHPARDLNSLLSGGVYKPNAWSMRLSSMSKHCCIVFAPHGFDIQNFRHDLMLLLALGTFGNFCNRTAHLQEWAIPASFLSADMLWGDVQGWWHKKHGVIVVVLMRDKAHQLWEHISRVLGLKDGSVTELDDGYPLIDMVFRTASEMFLEDVARTPRT